MSVYSPSSHKPIRDRSPFIPFCEYWFPFTFQLSPEGTLFNSSSRKFTHLCGFNSFSNWPRLEIAGSSWTHSRSFPISHFSVRLPPSSVYILYPIYYTSIIFITYIFMGRDRNSIREKPAETWETGKTTFLDDHIYSIGLRW